MWRAARVASLCVGVAVLALAAPRAAEANFIGNLVTVNVSTGSDNGSWSLSVPSPSDPFTWSLPIGSPQQIVGQDNVTVLATIQTLAVSLDGDPQASVVFGVIAGPVPTNFSITSAVVGFPGILNPQAVASAQIGITDLNSNGGSLGGNYAGNTKAFEARYNGPTVFAHLDTTPLVVGPNGSTGTFEQFPLVGTTPIAGLVSSIQVEFNFTLSAGDLGSGSGQFTVVPEPTSIALAAMGGVGLVVLMARRWRRK
jgi:hypothetical protein